MSEDKTIGEIWAEILDKLSFEEKKVLYFVIGKAASGMLRDDDVLTAWNNLGFRT